MPIIISKEKKNAIRIEKSSFKEEAELQKYIFHNPESIPLDAIKENARFLVIDREFPVSVGNIDALGIDNEGDIYIIETKLYKNPDKRFVLAQVLDYGASLWGFYDDPDVFIQKLDQRLRAKRGIGLVEELEEAFGNGEAIAKNLKQNLLNSAFKFIILMDLVPPNLKNLILFINQNSQFSVYSVELEYYTHEGYEILIPHVFGAESKKKAVSIPGRKMWDEVSFFKDARKIPEVYEPIHKLYEFSKEKADEITWGTGASTGSFNPKFYSISARSIYTVWSDGRLTINFGWLNDSEHTLQWREKLHKELGRIGSIAAYVPKTCDKYPIIPPKAWIPVVDQFMGTITKLLGAE